MNGASSPQFLVGPSSLNGARDLVDGRSSPDRSATAVAGAAATASDPASSDFSVLSNRPSDVNGAAMATNGTAFTESMAAGLTPAAAEFVAVVLQQNKQLKDRLSDSHVRIKELLERGKNQNVELKKKDDALLAKDGELRQRNQQCKLKIEELTATISDLQRKHEKSSSLQRQHQPSDSTYKSGTGADDASSYKLPGGVVAMPAETSSVDVAAESETTHNESLKSATASIDQRLEIIKLQSERDAKDEEIQHLTKEIKSLKELVEELNKKLDQSSKILLLTENNVAILTGRNNELQTQVEKYCSEIGDLNKAIRAAEVSTPRSDVSQVQPRSEGDENSRKIDSLMFQQLAEASREREQSRECLAKERQQRQDLQSRFENLDHEHLKVRAENANLRRSLKDMEAQLKDLREGYKAQLDGEDQVRVEISDLRTRLGSVEQQRAEVAEENSKLRKDRDANSQRYDQLLLKNNTTEAALVAERRENARIKQSLNEKTMKLDDLKRNYDILLKQHEEASMRPSVNDMKEQIDELRTVLHEAQQLARRRGDEVSELRRQLDGRDDDSDSVVVLKHQLEVYRLDFEAERRAREEKHAEAERLHEQLEQLQQRHQQLFDELEAYSSRHLDDMRRRHAQPAAAATAAAAAAATTGASQYDQYGRATPGVGVQRSGSTAGGAGPSVISPSILVPPPDASQAGAGHQQLPGRLGGGPQPWSQPARPHPTALAESEPGDYMRDVPIRPSLYRSPGSGTALQETQFEVNSEARTPFAATAQGQQQQRLIGGYHSPSRPPQSTVEVGIETRPGYPIEAASDQHRITVGHQAPSRSPQSQPQQQFVPSASHLPPTNRVDSLRCPVCNLDLPDFDSLNVHVNECIDLHGAG